MVVSNSISRIAILTSDHRRESAGDSPSFHPLPSFAFGQQLLNDIILQFPYSLNARTHDVADFKTYRRLARETNA